MSQISQGASNGSPAHDHDTMAGHPPARHWLFDLFVSVSIVSLLLTPYLVRIAPGLGQLFTARGVVQRDATGKFVSQPPLDGPGIIVVGYGLAGQTLVEPLLRHHHRITVVDFQAANVQLALNRGLAAVIGDARNHDLLEHLRLRDAVAVVVALPDHQTVTAVIHQIRVLAPGMPIVARARYHRFAHEIVAAGATVVVDEEQQIGHRLGMATRHLLRHSADRASAKLKAQD